MTSHLEQLSRFFAEGGWPAVSPAFVKRLLALLLQLLLLPLLRQPLQEAGWAVALRAADALKALAAAAASRSGRRLLAALSVSPPKKNQRPQVRLQDLMLEALEAAAVDAAAEASPSQPPAAPGTSVPPPHCDARFLPLMAAAAERILYILIPRLLLCSAPRAVLASLFRAGALLLLLPVAVSSPSMPRLLCGAPAAPGDEVGSARHNPAILLLLLLLLHVLAVQTGTSASAALGEEEPRVSSEAQLQQQLEKLEERRPEEEAMLKASAAAASDSPGSKASRRFEAASAKSREVCEGLAVETCEDSLDGSGLRCDGDLGDGVKLEGKRAAAFLMQAAISLRSLNDACLETPPSRCKALGDGGEVTTLAVLLALLQSRRALMQSVDEERLASQTLEALLEP